MSVLRIGPLDVEWGSRTYVMGIINVTPDSFSGDGLLNESDTIEAAVAQAQDFVAAGADFLDIGGESTRPGSEFVSEDEEMARVVPVISAVAQEVEVAISIDTYKASVARAALDAGAHLVNNVWSGRLDPELPRLVAERGVPYIVMHNRLRPKNVAHEARLGGRFVGIDYEDLLGDVVREVVASIELVTDAGIRRTQIIIDPGIGFGKSVSQSLELLDRLGELRVLGYPILLGPSRKSFIGYTLDLPPDERVEGTAATIAVGITRGADIVRVHDVRAMTRVARMTDAIVRRAPRTTD